VQGESHFLLRVLRGRCHQSGESRERVTRWSGCIGLTALAEVSGQRPERVKGRALWVLRAKP